MQKTCIICQMSISPGEKLKTCERCQAKYHQGCWTENGGCATYGCQNAPVIEKNNNGPKEKESYWGTKTKSCPLCGETIDVYATICPYCKENFGSSMPITQQELKEQRTTVKETDSKKNIIAIIIFICGLLGITAPINLFFGGMWYKDNREFLKEHSPVFNLLVIIGLIISSIYTLAFIIAIIT